MTASSSLPLFLLGVIGISLSGVMMPGPVTAVTISKGTQHKAAGAMVAIGHAIIELPLIALIYFGLSRFLKLDGVQIGLGLAGGLVLIWMALGVFRTQTMSLGTQYENPHQGAIFAGVLTTAVSPFFFLWWATVGANMIADANAFGKTGIVALGATHWLCDAGWLLLISWVVFQSKRLWTPTVHRWIFGICALTLAGFGAYFIFSSVKLALAA